MFDFDGTISPADMGHVIFNAFADQSWRDIDDEWVQGHIPTSERARRQFELVRAGEQEFLALIDQHKVDPDFSLSSRFSGKMESRFRWSAMDSMST